MTFGQLAVTFSVSAVFIYLLAGYIGFMSEMDNSTKVAVAIMMATIFVARSPASAIAVINEMRAKGSFVQMAMGVTVIKDFFSHTLFAICFSVAGTLVSGEPFTIKFLLFLLGELACLICNGFYSW